MNNKINGWIPFISFSDLVLCILAHCHGLMGHLNRAETLLMLFVKSVLFLLPIEVGTV